MKLVVASICAYNSYIADGSRLHKSIHNVTKIASQSASTDPWQNWAVTEALGFDDKLVFVSKQM